MAKCYQCDDKGFFVGETDDCGGFLPAGAVYDAPKLAEGFIPRRNAGAWQQVKNSKGEKGYLDGRACTIKNYGPLPEGWSKTPPPPTPEELAARRITAIDARLAAIDRESVRPLRALLDTGSTDDDKKKLEDLEREAKSLRAARKAPGEPA